MPSYGQPTNTGLIGGSRIADRDQGSGLGGPESFVASAFRRKAIQLLIFAIRKPISAIAPITMITPTAMPA